MENTSEKESKMLNEIKVAGEMGVAATERDIRAYPGLCITDIDGADLEQRIQRILELPDKDGDYALRRVIPVETLEKSKDELYIKMETEGMLTSRIAEAFSTCWWKTKFVACVGSLGCANDCIENLVKPEIGLLFTGATMQNMYQLITSGVVTSGRGRTLMKMN